MPNSQPHSNPMDIFGQQFFSLDLRNELAVSPDEGAVVELFSGFDYSAFSRSKGRPCKVDPMRMVMLLVYGSTEGRYSCRELETMLRKDVFLIKLFQGMVVGHNTINRFVKGNAAQIDDIFRQLVMRLGRLAGYRAWIGRIGSGRRSCPETDPDATFMRMKEDHMRNGQLKPSYNVQDAVDSGHVVCCTVVQDRADYRTAVGMPGKLAARFPWKYRNYCADSGYDLLENFNYCEAHGIQALIKPQYWEASRRRSFKDSPGRAENMTYDPEGDTFTCKNGRKLHFSFARRNSGGPEPVRNYESGRGCKTCPYSGKCLTRKVDKQTGRKHVSVMLGHMRARKKAELALRSRFGTEARMNRSIQAEGSFAEAKRNLDLRRFASGGIQRVLTEWIIRCMAQDVVRYMCRTIRGVAGNPFWVKVKAS